MRSREIEARFARVERDICVERTNGMVGERVPPLYSTPSRAKPRRKTTSR